VVGIITAPQSATAFTIPSRAISNTAAIGIRLVESLVVFGRPVARSAEDGTKYGIRVVSGAPLESIARNFYLSRRLEQKLDKFLCASMSRFPLHGIVKRLRVDNRRHHLTAHDVSVGPIGIN
jgi:hypothetical protein